MNKERKIEISEQEANNYLTKYKLLLYKFANYVTNRAPKYGLDDAYQLLAVRLLFSITQFRNDVANEVTFVYHVLQNEANNIIRLYLSKSNLVNANALSYDVMEEDNYNLLELAEGDDTYNIEQTYSKKELVDEILSIIATFPEKDMKVMLLYIEGYKVKEISKMLDIKEKNVYNTITRLKSRIIEELSYKDLTFYF